MRSSVARVVRYSEVADTAIARTLWVLLCVALSACGQRDSTAALGVLYCGANEYVMQINLDTARSEPLNTLGDVTVRGLQALDGDEVLALTEKQRNAHTFYGVNRFNIRRFSYSALVEGASAAYLRDAGYVVFDTGTRVRIVNTRPGEPDPGVTLFTHPFTRNVHMLPVNGSRLLYQAERDGHWQILTYDVQDTQLTPAPALQAVCHLQDAVWLGRRNLLACRASAGTTSPYRLVDLEGTHAYTLALPQTPPLRAVAYVNQADVLILTGAGRADDEAGLWSYAITSERLERLTRGANVSGTCVHSDALN